MLIKSYLFYRKTLKIIHQFFYILLQLLGDFVPIPLPGGAFSRSRGSGERVWHTDGKIMKIFMDFPCA